MNNNIKFKNIRIKTSNQLMKKQKNKMTKMKTIIMKFTFNKMKKRVLKNLVKKMNLKNLKNIKINSKDFQIIISKKVILFKLQMKKMKSMKFINI